MEIFLKWDEALFHLINGAWANALFDVVMPFITDKSNFYAPFVIGWLGLLIFGGTRGRKVALALVVLIIVSDQTALFFKNLFQRIRPCAALDGVRLIAGAGCGSSYSFPSNHAVNIFAQMSYLSYNYRRLLPAFAVAAFLVAYSRVYVGAHYPSDVVAGALIGVFISIAAIVLEKKVEEKIKAWRKGTGSTS